MADALSCLGNGHAYRKLQKTVPRCRTCVWPFERAFSLAAQRVTDLSHGNDTIEIQLDDTLQRIDWYMKAKFQGD